MKFLITGLIFFATLPALADNWMRIDGGLKRGFELKQDCESGGRVCQKVDGLDFDSLALGSKEVDDLEKPVYEAKSNIQVCATRSECDALRQAPDFCPATYSSISAPVEAGGWEAYCTKLLGYEKKQVAIIVEDPALKAAKEAKLAEQSAKVAKQATIKSDLRACIDTVKESTATAAQVRRCVLLLLRDRLKEELASSEL